MGIKEGVRGLLFGKTDSPAAKKPTNHRNHHAHKRYAVAQHHNSTAERFRGGSRSIDSNLRNELVKIREASRNAGDDVGYVTRYFNMVQTHVVGETGLRLQVDVKNKNGDTLRDINRAIETAFNEWSEMGSAEVGGRMSWVGVQDLVAKTVAQDGEVLIRYHYDPQNKYGFSVELIEADLLDVTLNQVLSNGNRIVMGVELDGQNRRVAYHLLTNHPGDDTWVNQGQRYHRVSADEMDLLYVVWRPGQNRGIPWAHASLLEMYQINSMRSSQLTSARIASANMAFYERDPEQEIGDEFDDDGELLHELESGQMSVVPEGYKVTQTTFQPPANSDFQKDALRGSASGMGVNYNVLGNDYEGVSFSSLRQAILEDRDAWKRKQRWLIEQLATPVFNRWLKMALLKNAIPGLKASQLSLLKKHKFHGRRWQWVDPLKDEQAAGAALDNLTTSPMHILRDKGIDPEDVAAGWEEFGKLMEPHLGTINKLMPKKAALVSAANAEQQGEPEPTDEE